MRTRTAVVERTTTVTAEDAPLDNLDGLMAVADDVLDLVGARLPRGPQQAQALAIAAAAAAVQNGVPLRVVRSLLDEWGA
jgi:hypothetical protein